MEIIDPINEHCPCVEEGDAWKIFGVSRERFSGFREHLDRLDRMEKGLSTLPSAVLLTIVATFDSQISEIVRELLVLKPERFDSGERTIAVAEVLKMSSFEELRSKLVDDEIYLFSRGGHDDQIKYIEKSFHIQIIKHWKRWPDFIEVFERRNLIAHGEREFTARYVRICKQHGHKVSEKLLGSKIELTQNYLAQAQSILIEFCILLLFSVWRKQFPGEEQQAFDSVGDVGYRLIMEKRYKTALRVLEYVLSLQGTTVTAATRLRLTVNLASAYRHAGEESKAKAILNEVDWSATSDNYRICVAALRSDVDTVIELLDMVSGSKEPITADDIREWPVFDYVRDDERFRDAFQRVYKQPLTEVVDQQTLDKASSEKIVEQAGNQGSGEADESEPGEAGVTADDGEATVH